MAKFRGKPIIVEAEQFWSEKEPKPEDVRKIDGANYFLNAGGIYMQISDGDWIITEENGDRYVYEKKYFEEEYEPVG